MTIVDVPCPNRQVLEAFLDDSENPANGVGSHVRGCQSCQRVLDELCADADLDVLKRQLSTLSNYHAEAKCLKLVSQLSSIDTISSLNKLTPNPAASDFVSILPPKIEGDLGAIDHYRLIRELGRGGMSIVYEAIDVRLQRSVAIKVLRSTGNDLTANQRFVREAKAVGAISHPNVIAIYDVEMQHGSTAPYLVMELVRGPTLQEFIKHHGIVQPRTAATWVAQVAKGLAAAHHAGIVHRDIKSSNILLSPIDSHDQSSPFFQPKLADFGLAKTEQIELHLTQSGYLTGTPAYASPEQVQANDASTLSDIYSLGITLYEAISGELPFRGAPLAVIKQIADGELTNPRRLNPNIPTDLETICLKAVNYRASQRYQSALGFAEDLNRWLEGKPILARPSSWIEHAWRWGQRNKRVTALVTTIFGLLLAIAIGGVLSTLSIAKARNELAIQAAEALKFSSEAQEASLQAMVANQLAQEQRQLALDSLNSLIEQVRTKLASRPGTVKLREELLRTALSGLDRVMSGGDRTSIDHASISAGIQMANLQSILGDSVAAREEAEHVIELASQGMGRNPGDSIAMRDYALALGLRADTKKRIFAYDDAKQNYLEILDIYQRLRENTPDDFVMHREWISVQQKLADIDLRTSQLEAARVQFQRMLDEIVLLKERYPGNSELERDHYVALTQLSSAHLALGLPNVLELLTQAIAIAENLANQELENTIYATDIANLLARVARHEISQNNSANAISFAKRALQKYEQCAAQDPSNLQAQMRVGTAWDGLHQAYLNGDELEQAEAAELASFDIHVHVAERDPKTTLYLILAMEAASRVSDVQFRIGKYPQSILWSEKSIELLDKCRLQQDYLPSTFDPLREIYAAFLESMRLFTLEGHEGNPTSSDPCVQMYRNSVECFIRTQQGDHAAAFSLASRVLETCTNGEAESQSKLLVHFPVTSCLLAARAISVSYRQLLIRNNVIDPKTKASGEKDCEKFKTLAFALLHFATQKQPGLEATLRTDPDFARLGKSVGK